MGIEEGLEDQHRCYLIDQWFVFLAGFACRVQNLMRLARGKPFIPQVQRQAGQFGKLAGERAIFFRLGAGLAREMQRIASHDACAAKTPAEPSQGAHVVARISLSGESEHRLSGQAEFVRDGYTDALGAYVEPEITRRSLQRNAPAISLSSETNQIEGTRILLEI